MIWLKNVKGYEAVAFDAIFLERKVTSHYDIILVKHLTTHLNT